jgi:hypothetical protein
VEIVEKYQNKREGRMEKKMSCRDKECFTDIDEIGFMFQYTGIGIKILLALCLL